MSRNGNYKGNMDQGKIIDFRKQYEVKVRVGLGNPNPVTKIRPLLSADVGLDGILGETWQTPEGEPNQKGVSMITAGLVVGLCNNIKFAEDKGWLDRQSHVAQILQMMQDTLQSV